MAMHDTQRVTTADLVAGGPAVAIMVLAVVSLALAHGHHHSGAAVLVISGLILGAGGVVALRARRRSPHVIGADRRGTAAVVACGAVAAFMFLPGFSFGVADKDAGGYVQHAVEIARTGSYSFTDPALAAGDLPVASESPGARLPAVWVRNAQTGLIVPQFLHMWPALMATSYDLAGWGGLDATGPLVAVAAVMVMVGLLRRLVGTPGAVVGGLLLATNMLEVWQAKFPTTEGLAQMLFLTVLLGAVIALQTRLVFPAVIAGVAVGASFLNRVDAWLLVMGSAAGIAALVVLRRADRRVIGFAAGWFALLPYAFWAAYSASVSYTAQNAIPNGRKSSLILVLLAVVAIIGRFAMRPLVPLIDRVVANRRSQLAIGIGVAGVALALLALGFLRPRLFGIDYGDFNGRIARTYDEQILRRLSWFVTIPGFVVMAVGLVVATLRRWRAETWIVLAPILVFFPVFAYTSRNSTRLMWWTRRYIPIVLPGIVILIAIALGVALVSKARGRRLLQAPAAVVAAALVVVFLRQSLPLRSHHEWEGSVGVVNQLAALSGGATGVYLWQPTSSGTPPLQIFATPIWLDHGMVSVLLPPDPLQDAGYIAAYRKAFPGKPVFVVFSTAGSHPDLVSTGLLHEVKRLTGSFDNWEQSDTTRPRKAQRSPYDMTVYRVART